MKISASQCIVLLMDFIVTISKSILDQKRLCKRMVA